MQIVLDKSLIIALKTVLVNLTWLRDIHSRKQDTVGESERIFGKWLKKMPRKEIIVTTKVTGRNNESWYGEQSNRLTYNRIRNSIKNSLNRLNSDYIDVFFLHWPDRYTNNFGRKFYNPDPDPRLITFEEQFAALKESHQQGEIRAIGFANETPWGLMKFIECNRANNIKIYVQDSFSILNRSIEISMKEIILRENIIFQAHSILAGGLLSGKYEVHNGDYAGEGRLSKLKHQTRKLRDKEILRNYEKLKSFCEENNLQTTSLALSFVMSSQFVREIILGAASINQLENLLDVIKNPASIEQIRSITNLIYPH